MNDRSMLPEAERRALSKELRVMVDECGGNQSEAARRFGLRQQTINVGLGGNVGPVVQQQILRVRKTTMARLFEKYGIDPDADPDGPPCRQIPGWEDAALVAGRKHPELAEAIMGAGDAPLPEYWWPPRATPRFVTRMARTYLERAAFLAGLRRESSSVPIA